MTDPLVIHSHLHRRRTGVTGHVELIVPGLSQLMETRAFGNQLSPTVPRIGWRELFRRIRTESVIWHAHRNNEMYLGLLLKLLGRRVRLVFTRHRSRPPSGITAWLARLSDRLVTLNRQCADWMRVPSTIISHGVDLDRFQPPANRAAAWQRLGLGGSFGIGVVGRIRAEKGQGDFVEAIAPLLSQHPDWRPVLVGLAKGRDRSWAQMLRKKTGDALVLVGEQSNVVPWYQGLSVVVHPSYAEAFSMVLVEAMASGCCVVATRLPHHPDIIEHGRTGFLYEPGDTHSLRAILASLMARPEQAHTIGRNAAKEAKNRFGIEHEAAKLAELYRGL